MICSLVWLCALVVCVRCCSLFGGVCYLLCVLCRFGDLVVLCLVRCVSCLVFLLSVSFFRVLCLLCVRCCCLFVVVCSSAAICRVWCFCCLLFVVRC